MFRKTSIAAATLLLALVTGSPALAEQLTRVVRYYDLDLSNRAGVRSFTHRMHHAINSVCRVPSPAHPLTGAEDQKCRAEVMAKVQPQMQVAIELAQTRAANQIAAR